MARPRDTSWHEAFLGHVAGGMSFPRAAGAAGVSYSTVKSQLRANPEFRTKAEAARSPRAYNVETAWHDRLLDMIAAGLTRRDAADLLGIHPWTIWRHSQIYPRLRDGLAESRQRTGRSRGLFPNDPRREQVIAAFAVHIDKENRMPDQIQGYEAEPEEVEALLAVALADINEESDPAVRYVMVTKELLTYQALVSRLADQRARAVAAMHKPGGMSYQQIADALQLGTRGRAQQLVERGRA